MSNYQRTGAAWLADQLFAQAGEDATYRRGLQSIPLRIVRGRTDDPVDVQEEFEVAARRGDFVIRAAELTLGLPETEDQIEVGDEIWRITPPGPGEQQFRYADPYRIQIRVRAQQVNE